MRRTRVLAIPVALLIASAPALAVVPASAAGAGTFYTIDTPVGGLLTLDPTAGTLATVGPMTPVPDTSGMVLNSSGAGYAITFGSTTQLLAVDAPVPLLVPLGTVIDPVSAPVEDCVGMGRDGTDLILACDVGSVPVIGRLNTTTLVFTTALTWPFVDPPVSLATAANGETFAATAGGGLVHIDLSPPSGPPTATFVGPSGPSTISNLAAITFDGNGLYGIAIVAATGRLSFIAIDPTSGIVIPGAELANQAFQTNSLAVVSALGAGAPPAAPTLAASGGGAALAWAPVALGLVALGVSGMWMARLSRRRSARS